MADIYVMSYSRFNQTMKEMAWSDSNIGSGAAIISISNTDGTMPHWFKNEHSNVLNIDFDDCTKSDPKLGIKAITQDQANKIARFMENNKSAWRIFVHCEAGISRSAAVALCFIDYLRSQGYKDNTLHIGYSIHPNPTVEERIHRALFNYDNN